MTWINIYLNELFTWGSIVIFRLSSCKPIVVVVIPSITIEPSAGSIILNRACVRDDLPAPVLPTIPTCSYKKVTKYSPKSIIQIICFRVKIIDKIVCSFWNILSSTHQHICFLTVLYIWTEMFLSTFSLKSYLRYI